MSVCAQKGAPSPLAVCEGLQPVRPTKSFHYLSGLDVYGPHLGSTLFFSKECHLHSSWLSFEYTGLTFAFSCLGR